MPRLLTSSDLPLLVNGNAESKILYSDEPRLIAAIRNALTGYLVASLFLHAAYPQPLWLLLALAWATPQCVRRRDATVSPLVRPRPRLASV